MAIFELFTVITWARTEEFHGEPLQRYTGAGRRTACPLGSVGDLVKRWDAIHMAVSSTR